MANTAFGHDATLTTPGSTTNTALVRWANTSGSSLNNTANILSDGSHITLNARGEVRFADADSSHYIALEAPATVGTTYTMSLPAAVPSANDYLKVTSYSGGAGVLEWDAVSAGGAALTGSTNNTITTVTGANAIQGEANLTFDGANLYLINSATSSSSNIMAYSSATSTATPARLILRVASGNTGDAFVTFHNQTGGGVEWALGLDNSDSNKFKLGHGGTVDSNTVITVESQQGSRANNIVTFHSGNGDADEHGFIFFDHPNESHGLSSHAVNGPYSQQAINTTTLGTIGQNWHDTASGICISGYTEGNYALGLVAWPVTETTTQASNQGAAVAILGWRHDGSNGSDTFGSSANIVRIGCNRSSGGATKFIFRSDGTGYAETSWTTYSDNRIKTEQAVVPYGLDTIMQLQPKVYNKHVGSIEDGVVTFHDELEESPHREIGFIAQEVKAIIPEVIPSNEDENNSWYALDDGKLMAVVVKAIQELNAKVDALGS